MIVISAGMPKSGSGWYFNLTNSLIAGHQGQDVRQLRERSRLLRRVTKSADGNCSMARLRAHRLVALFAVGAGGTTFTVKTHSPPTPSTRLLLASGRAKATYCYRDLRDVALSAVDHRHKLEDRTAGRVGGSTLGQSIDFATQLVPAWRAWTSIPGVLTVSYEDLRGDPEREVGRLAEFLGIEVEPTDLRELLAQHPPGQGSSDWLDGLHFNRGEAGRFLQEMSVDELAYANRVLGPLLAEMGYDT